MFKFSFVPGTHVCRRDYLFEFNRTCHSKRQFLVTRSSPVVNFEEIRVFQACTCDQRLNLTQVHLALCASAPTSLFLSYHTVVVCLCAHSQHHVTDSSDRFMAQEQNSAHPFTIFHQLYLYTVLQSTKSLLCPLSKVYRYIRFFLCCVITQHSCP